MGRTSECVPVGLIDHYTTQRKVFVEGMRAAEIGLSVPDSEVLRSGKATISLPGQRKPRRRMYRRLNHCAVNGYAPLCMDTNDPDTVKCGFVKRLLRDVPQTNVKRLNELRDFVVNYCKKFVRHTEVMGFEEWLASTSYNESRKNELRRVEAELKGLPPTERQGSHIDTFVKSECYMDFKSPRMINSRSDYFKVFSGPRFKAIEEVVYELPEFIKHVAVPDRPKKILELKKAGRRYFQTDFTAYESHFVPEVMRACEFVLYKWCLHNDVHVDFMCRVLEGANRMRTRTGIRAQCYGRRMSGDMCTSLGNGWTNLMLAKFLAQRQNAELHGFVEGDDGLFATTATLTKTDYELMGFTIKIEEVADPCHASFCGMIFAESGEIIKDPIKFMCKFGWTLSDIYGGRVVMDQLLKAKSLSAIYETPQCPIIGALARLGLKESGDVTPRWPEDTYHMPPPQFNIPAFKPHLDTRLLFEQMFGIDVPTQLLVEDMIMRHELNHICEILPPPAPIQKVVEDYIVVA